MAISTLNTTDTFNTWRTLFNNLVNEHNSGSTSIVDGDDDTKIQVEESSDEDIIRFDTGGTERLKIQSDGTKVISNGRLTMSSAFIDFSGNISTPQTGAAIFRPADNTLAFSTANEERVRIDSNGRVNIGEASDVDLSLIHI